MSDEVREVVDNIIRGTTTNSPEEWMLREYQLMMKRECELRAQWQRKPASDTNGGAATDMEWHSYFVSLSQQSTGSG
mgnify:CR=1 FL=1